MSKDAFGINMKDYCREHENVIRTAIENDDVSDDLIKLHKEKIAIVQHERLVHLIVTFMVVILLLFLMGLSLLHTELGILPIILTLIVLILVGFYLYHYFFLENTLQRWYKMLDLARKKD
ncbi:MAG: hypothetical protein K5644_01220 [Lachnospiraceae bacterium]|nr:hypothetical protein [Lachnospiraceae bacterium]